MTPKQYAELLEYIIQNNGWNKVWENGVEKGRPCFKYIDATFDSRDGLIWQIVFREDGSLNNLKEKVFHTETEEDIKAIYDFLNTQFKK